MLMAPTDTTSKPPTWEPSDKSLTSHPTLSNCSHTAVLAQKFAHHSSRKSRYLSHESRVWGRGIRLEGRMILAFKTLEWEGCKGGKALRPGGPSLAGGRGGRRWR